MSLCVSLPVSLGVSLMYLHHRCLGRSSVSLAVSLGVSLGVSLAVSLCVWFVVILAAGLLAAGLLAALYLRRLTWRTCLRRACWRQHHTPAAPKLARRGAVAGGGGMLQGLAGRQRGSCSGLVCVGKGGREAAARGWSAESREAERQLLGAGLRRLGRQGGGIFGGSATSDEGKGCPAAAVCPTQ